MTSEVDVWTVLIPMKPLAEAKTRLRESQQVGATPSASDLAQAFLRDVISAAQGAVRTSRVVVTGEDPAIATLARQSGAHFLPEPTAAAVGDHDKTSLNAAIAAALGSVKAEYGSHPIVVVTGDLAALRSESLDSILSAVEDLGESGFVADTAGTGTTMLALLPTTAANPRFGSDSAAAHRSQDIRDVSHHASADARLDVDTPADLHAALILGVGSHTERVMTQRS